MRWLGFAFIVVGLAIGAAGLYRYLETDGEPPHGMAAFSLERRPQQDRYLFDYAGILEHYQEGAHKYLRRIAEHFHIEAMIVSLPNLGSADSLETLAVDILNQWEIGREYEGRGLLLLLVNQGKTGQTRGRLSARRRLHRCLCGICRRSSVEALLQSG